ncbi:MAG: hypothetical protein IPP17_29615 [Bacteroidetes bacterium]|nr:hypothetical protein [Bacteroidota bacterium]
MMDANPVSPALTFWKLTLPMEIDHSWKKEGTGKGATRGKRYLHFDSKVSVQAYADRVCDPEWVLRHGFLPFLHIRIDTPRVRFSETEQKRLLQKKSRDIFFASHVDSLIYSRYAYHLQRAYEQYLADKPGVSASVLAYRSIGRNTLHFAKETFDWIQAQRHPLVALCFDIKSFFDNMSHAILLENWKAVAGVARLSEDCYRVFQANTRFAWVEEVCMHDLFPELHEKGYRQRICSPDAFREVVRGKKFVHVNKHDFGVPQGSALSAVLSNVYMLDLDAGLVDFAKEYGGLYRRYSDDILIVCGQGMKPRRGSCFSTLYPYSSRSR